MLVNLKTHHSELLARQEKLSHTSLTDEIIHLTFVGLPVHLETSQVYLRLILVNTTVVLVIFFLHLLLNGQVYKFPYANLLVFDTLHIRVKFK